MTKAELIEKITPLYNSYKSKKEIMPANQAIEIMWEIGNLLKQYIEGSGIKPHTLYRDIYGKSEGRSNIVQKSYITREFQGRCYRIRCMFLEKGHIVRDLPTLSNFTIFREAMPFFDNSKYKMEGNEREELLRLLNAKMAPNVGLKLIKALQTNKIQRKNPRTQRLKEAETLKNDFINFYNEIYRLIKIKNYKEVMDNLTVEQLDSDYIKIMAKNTASLAQEGLQFYDFKPKDSSNLIWKSYSNNVKRMANQVTEKLRRRFRRLISPARIMRLVDMLYALNDKQLYDEFQ